MVSEMTDQKKCLPWKHDWRVNKHITVPVWDKMARGILKECRRCGTVIAK